MLIKGVVVAVLVKLRGSDSETAWRSGLALAQGGEFCFALMAQMQQNRLIPDEFNGLLLAATFCSMLLTPLLLRAAPAIALRLHRKPNQEVQTGRNHRAQCRVARPCGDLWLRPCRAVHRALSAPGATSLYRPGRRPGTGTGSRHEESSVHYGDCRRGDLLSAVGLERARLVVIAVDNSDVALVVLKEARRINARCRFWCAPAMTASGPN